MSLEKIRRLEDFDEVQFIANETVNGYVNSGELTEIKAYDYMARLGATFIRLTWRPLD